MPCLGFLFWNHPPHFHFLYLELIVNFGWVVKFPWVPLTWSFINFAGVILTSKLRVLNLHHLECSTKRSIISLKMLIIKSMNHFRVLNNEEQLYVDWNSSSHSSHFIHQNSYFWTSLFRDTKGHGNTHQQNASNYKKFNIDIQQILLKWKQNKLEKFVKM